MQLGNILKDLRLKNHLTCKQVADFCGVSEVGAWQWENNIYTPRYDKLKKLAELFNVSIDYLLGVTDNPTIEKKKASDGELKNNEFLIAFDAYSNELTDDDKKLILSITKELVNQKKNKK